MALRELEEAQLQARRRAGEIQRELRELRAGRRLVGTPAEREAHYGTMDAAQQVELANSRPLWFNIERGWEESYYLPAGTPGLTVRGLQAGVPAGWYPTGPGPYIRMEPFVSTYATPSATLANWDGGITTNAGTDWFIPDTFGIQIQKAGRYDVEVWTNQQPGAGTADYHFRRNAPGDASVKRVIGLTVLLNASFYTRDLMKYSAEPVDAGDRFRLLCASGSLLVHQGSEVTIRGAMSARYLGPRLA